jgi:hypothetical protein
LLKKNISDKSVALIGKLNKWKKIS